MNQRRILLALFLIYFVFAILLNSVGTVILQVINNYGIDKSSASVLEGFKDLPIAIVSFLVASSLPRFGYKKAMLVALAIVACACLAMPLLPAFGTAKLLFLCVGVAFALVKVSVYTTVGLVAQDRKQHAGIMNTLEGFFMVGVLSAYWIFGWFIDSSNPASTSWLNVYWLLSGLCALTFVLVLFTRFDDFGTGYSSFSYLKRLPIDKLKVDKSFIIDMTQSAESLAIVQAIVAMAHRLHLVVVAEGVETADQVAALRKAECDQIQGYYYSRPLRAADCAAYIRAHGAAVHIPPRPAAVA